MRYYKRAPLGCYFYSRWSWLAHGKVMKFDLHFCFLCHLATFPHWLTPMFFPCRHWPKQGPAQMQAEKGECSPLFQSSGTARFPESGWTLIPSHCPLVQPSAMEPTFDLCFSQADPLFLSSKVMQRAKICPGDLDLANTICCTISLK